MANIEQLNKIRALEKSGSTSSNKTIFENLHVCYLDAPIKEHYPKVLDSNGSKKKDENGNDLRSDRADGFTYTFSEIGTSQVVKVVLPKKYKFLSSKTLFRLRELMFVVGNFRRSRKLPVATSIVITMLPNTKIGDFDG